MTTQPSAGRTARLLAIVVSPLVLATTLTVIGTATPDYRPWADAFSRLASYDEPYPVLTRAGFVVYGLLVVAGAGPLDGRVLHRPKLLSRFVAGYGAAAAVAGIAPKDPPRTPHTLTSTVHVASTIVGGAVLLAAMAWVALRAFDRADRRVAATALVVTAGAAAVFPFTWGSAIYGIVEWLMLARASLWLAQLALRSVIADRGPAPASAPRLGPLATGGTERPRRAQRLRH